VLKKNDREIIQQFVKGVNRMRRLLPLAAALGLLAVTVTGAQASSGGTSNLTVSAGTGLTVTGAAPGNFSVTLNGSDQTVTTTLGTYTAADSTGSGKGWNVTFQATAFKCTNSGVSDPCPSSGGDTLPSSSLLMAPPTVACASGQSCSGRAAKPSISIASNTALDSGAAVKVASAAVNAGMGTYNFTPGTIASGNLELAVPSYAYASTYTSTLTVSVVSGP
jgi:hypothetical protein